VQPTLAVITGFERRRLSKALLERPAPLLHILRPRVRIEARETHNRAAKHRLREIESGDLRSEVVALLGDGNRIGTLCNWLHHVFRSTGV